MKATKALPTEDRVKKMSDLQWLWSYFNILEDEKEEEQKWKSRLDYLGSWVNPQLARSVMEKEGKIVENDSNSQFVKGDIITNNEFEEEYKKALGQGSEDEEQFTELPDSLNVGNSSETSEDFISRVMSIDNKIRNEVSTKDPEEDIKSLEQTVKEMGLNIDDIDFFEFPDE